MVCEHASTITCTCAFASTYTTTFKFTCAFCSFMYRYNYIALYASIFTSTTIFTFVYMFTKIALICIDFSVYIITVTFLYSLT